LILTGFALTKCSVLPGAAFSAPGVGRGASAARLSPEPGAVPERDLVLAFILAVQCNRCAAGLPSTPRNRAGRMVCFQETPAPTGEQVAFPSAAGVPGRHGAPAHYTSIAECAAMGKTTRRAVRQQHDTSGPEPDPRPGAAAPTRHVPPCPSQTDGQGC